MNQPKVYFKGLNGLRFFAAFLVVMFHAELIRLKYSLFNLNQFSIFNSGGIAVEFFFVLSGFLITYLLLTEFDSTGTVSIKHFYLRRILRIWPLYYLILIIGLLLLPIAIKVLGIEYTYHYPLGPAALLFTFFLPNLVLTIWGSSFLAPLWSIGVEEQFYFIWAPLVKYFKKYAVSIFIVIIALRIAFYAYYARFDQTSESHYAIALKFIATLKFEAMSIGGLGAWLLYYSREKVMQLKIFNIGFQLLFFALIFIRLFFQNTLVHDTGWVGAIYRSVFDSSVYSVLITNSIFLWLIINISCNPKTIINTDNKVFDFLGNISYGIYMYHSIVLFVVMIFMKNILRPLSPVASTLLLYIVAGGLTILTAYLSFRFIESKFLTLKKRFEPKA